MTTPPKPETFRLPDALTVVPEYLVALAVKNVSALVGHDSRKADEVVRRALAALRLAEPGMPNTEVDYYPDGTYTNGDPIGVSSGAICQWGKLRRGGDVVMCALDEEWPDGEAAPGHHTPEQHAFRLPGSSTHIEFWETDPRAFHAPTWLGDEELADLAEELRTHHRTRRSNA